MTRFALILLAGIFSAVAQLPTVTLTPAFGTNGANGFTNPVWFGEIPGKSGNFLAVEQGNIAANTDSARIYVLIPQSGGTYQKQKFLSLKVRQGDAPEMGLLGFAFHPNYAQNRKYYISYNPPTRGNFDSTFIEERTAASSLLQDAGIAPRRILGIQKPRTNHNGGTMAFKDGYLYIGIGDGGEGANGLQTLLGAMLRIDVDHPANGLPYAIPADNPFVGNTTAGVRKEIWAYGFRNPWKWSFDPLNGDLWVADVGEGTAEEVDKVAKGNNMGWPVMEGNGCFSYSATKPNCSKTGLTLPVIDMTRTQAQCITGGQVFRGNPSSVFYGAYVFADWQSHRVYGLKQINGTWQLTQIASGSVEISSLAVDFKGSIYAVGHNNGIIYLLDHSGLVPVPVHSVPKGPKTGSIGPRLIPLLDHSPGMSNPPLFSLNGDEVHDVLGVGVYVAR